MVLDIITVGALSTLAVAILAGVHTLRHGEAPKADIDGVIDRVMDKIADKTISNAMIDITDSGVHIIATAADPEEEE